MPLPSLKTVVVGHRLSSYRCNPLPPPLPANAFIFNRQPDASMRCNFRFRLELVVIVIGFSLASVVHSTPLSCHTSPVLFDDAASRAVLASLVFEGHVISVHRHASAPNSSETAVLCHVTFAVKRIHKGELPSLTSSYRRKSSSVIYDHVTIIAQSRHLDDIAGSAPVDRCVVESADGELVSLSATDSSSASVVVFLQHSNESAIASSRSTAISLSSRRHRKSRGSPLVPGSSSSAVVYRFSSAPIPSSKQLNRQLNKVGDLKYAKVPGVKLMVANKQSRGRQSKEIRSRPGSRVQLMCRAVHARPNNVVFVWTKDGVCLQPSSRIKIAYNSVKSNSQLQIKSIASADEGQYGCHVINVVGQSAVHTLQVNVTSPKQTSSRRIVIDAESTSTGQGDLITTPNGDDVATNHLRACDDVDKLFCMNGGLCYVVMQLNSKLCNCRAGFEGARCQERRNGLNPDEELGKSNIRMSLLRKKRNHTRLT